MHRSKDWNTGQLLLQCRQCGTTFVGPWLAFCCKHCVRVLVTHLRQNMQDQLPPIDLNMEQEEMLRARTEQLQLLGVRV